MGKAIDNVIEIRRTQHYGRVCVKRVCMYFYTIL